jgi:hypothetical protein
MAVYADKRSLFGFCLLFRLDFDNFVTAAPDAVDNNCLTDLFVVSGGASIPPLCGTNTGQHSKLIMNFLNRSFSPIRILNYSCIL